MKSKSTGHPMLYSGHLLVRLNAGASNELRAKSVRDRRRLSRFQPEPLFQASSPADIPGQLLARDGEEWIVIRSDSEKHPWDVAHDVASQRGEAFAALAGLRNIYVEPDIQHSVPAKLAALDELDPAYPPKKYPNPAWHLKFARFFEGWDGGVKGQGIRVAHLDTGYFGMPDGTPLHPACPRRLKTELGWNFVEADNPKSAVDPGRQGFLFQPWHGTATMALLAGGQIDYSFHEQRYAGDIGGAPDADIVPVRISSSVVHLFTLTMARGLDYALAPRGDRAQKCDVVSVSMGGLPSLAWAAAVNRLYEAGIIVVSAAGNNFNVGGLALPMQETVWPARFERVFPAYGATYDRKAYRTDVNFEMQGCWGPQQVMERGVAAFSPNTFRAGVVASTDHVVLKPSYEMTFAGTSAATPQIAAACALWLQKHRSDFPPGPTTIEACRAALMRSADGSGGDPEHLGHGILNVKALLSDAVFNYVSNLVARGLPASPVADVSSRLLGHAFRAPPRSAAGKMLEVEAAQVFARARGADLVHDGLEVSESTPLPQKKLKKLRDAILAEKMSNRLRNFLEASVTGRRSPRKR